MKAVRGCCAVYGGKGVGAGQADRGGRCAGWPDSEGRGGGLPEFVGSSARLASSEGRALDRRTAKGEELWAAGQ